MRVVMALTVACVLGCGDEGSHSVVDTTAADTGGDTQLTPETVVAADSSGTAPEVSETALDVSETAEEVEDDTIAPLDVLDVTEVADTAGSDTTIEGPPGQCGDSSDCPGALFCAETAPGGICNGCSGQDPCPDGTWCNEFGSCSRDCETREDCPQGMRCHATQTVCVLESCSSPEGCGAPYACDDGFCRRPACGDDGSCPAPLGCLAGVCVEPTWLD